MVLTFLFYALHKILFFNKEKKCANKLIKLKSIYSIKFDADQQLNAPKKIRTIYWTRLYKKTQTKGIALVVFITYCPYRGSYNK